jgi:hypothetical protein
MKTAAEIYQETVSKLSLEERRAIFPPKVMKNFVVRKSWYGRGQIIKFTPKPTVNDPTPKEIVYDHDIAYELMLPILEHKGAWAKYGYWSQSTNIPLVLRHRDLLTTGDEVVAKPKAKAKAKAKK